MGMTLEIAQAKIRINNTAEKGEITRKLLELLSGYVEKSGYKSSCDHDVVIIGRTSSGDKVEICPICGETKYANYGEKGDLFKSVPKLDLRGQELCVTYPAHTSLLLKIMRNVIRDGAERDPNMDFREFLTTVDESVIAEYMKRETEEIKANAKERYKYGPPSIYRFW